MGNSGRNKHEKSKLCFLLAVFINPFVDSLCLPRCLGKGMIVPQESYYSKLPARPLPWATSEVIPGKCSRGSP